MSSKWCDIITGGYFLLLDFDGTIICGGPSGKFPIIESATYYPYAYWLRQTTLFVFGFFLLRSGPT